MAKRTVELASNLNSSGYGFGYGYGYGSGDGSGYGSGDGDKERKQYLEAILYGFRRPDAIIVFWRSKIDGSPANGGMKTKAAVGLTEEVQGPLKICTSK